MLGHAVHFVDGGVILRRKRMPTQTDAVGRGQAHGKVILMGEHAVVYGEPAISIPFRPVNANVAVQAADEEDVLNCGYYHGPLRKSPHSLKGLTELISVVRQNESMPPFLSVDIASNIPPAYGLGSSAAVAAALVRALYDFYHRPLPRKHLLELMNIQETHAHGTPSGVDARTAISRCPLWYVRGCRPLEISLPRPLFLVVAASNSPGRTLDVIRRVHENSRHFVDYDTPITRLGEMTRQAVEAIDEGNYQELGRLMTQSHQELINLGVSTLHLNSLVKKALGVGALGAKLTGSGGGGSIVAIAADNKVQERIVHVLAEAEAIRIWATTVPANQRLGDIHMRIGKGTLNRRCRKVH